MTFIGLCCIGLIIAQAAQPTDRPVTLADIQSLKSDLTTRIVELSAQVANVLNIAHIIQVEAATDRAQISRLREHTGDIQEKLNRSGIDGTRGRLIDEAWSDGGREALNVAKPNTAQVAIGGGLLGALVIALGKYAILGGKWVIDHLKP